MNIRTELRLCKNAFEGVEVGALVQCCHHEIPIEVLTETPINRIDYIMSDKPPKERARRLHEFRPVTVPIPEWLEKSFKEWARAHQELARALTKHQDETTALLRVAVPDTAWNGKSILDKRSPAINKAIIEVLRTWLEHDYECSSMTVDAGCTCGLDEIIRGIIGDTE